MHIYLDHNATTPPLPAVIDAVARAMRDGWGNASSIHARGQHARQAVDEARQRVAALVGCTASEIVFTSGGTESSVLALRGTVESRTAAGRRHLVTSAIEHEAVLQTARALARRGGEVTVVAPVPSGVVDAEAIAAAITDQTALVSLMLANNEIGTVQPVGAILERAHALGALVHTDAVQAAGKLSLDLARLDVDLLSLSAHKIGGPQGVGALFVRRGGSLTAQQTGGRQERNRRAGTENLAGIVGFGVAALHAAGTAADASRLAALRDAFERRILTTVAGAHVNGGDAPRVANTSNIGFDGVEAEALLIALDLEGIAVSTGAACSSGSLEPSHVLRAMGLKGADAQNAIRFSLGPTTAPDELDRAAEATARAVARLRRVADGRATAGRGRCG